jgi:hypothetical protein
MSNNLYKGAKVWASIPKSSKWMTVEEAGEGENNWVCIIVGIDNAACTIAEARAFAAHIMDIAKRVEDKNAES